ncbi:hypothetical protein TNCT_257871, partial [Trichonephila clavata]
MSQSPIVKGDGLDPTGVDPEGGVKRTSQGLLQDGSFGATAMCSR